MSFYEALHDSGYSPVELLARGGSLKELAERLVAAGFTVVGPELRVYHFDVEEVTEQVHDVLQELMRNP